MVLILGATGSVGSKVYKLCKEKGLDPFVLVRDLAKAKQLGAPDDRIIKGDLKNHASLLEDLPQVETLVSCLGVGMPQHKGDYEQIEVIGQQGLMDHLVNNGLKRIVYVSMLGAEDHRGISLIKAKHDMESYLDQLSINVMILQPTLFHKEIYNVYYKMALQGKMTYVGKGKHQVNPIHPDDVAAYLVDHLYDGQGIHPLGGPITYTQEELCEEVKRIARKPVLMKRLSKLQFLVATKVFGVLQPRFKGIFDYTFWLMTRDILGPSIGKKTLEQYIEVKKSTAL